MSHLGGAWQGDRRLDLLGLRQPRPAWRPLGVSPPVPPSGRQLPQSRSLSCHPFLTAPPDPPGVGSPPSPRFHPLGKQVPGSGSLGPCPVSSYSLP